MLDKYFVPYDRALKLKELDFDEECVAFYENNILKAVSQHWGISFSGISKRLGYEVSDLILAPLFCQVFDWFREKYNIVPNIHLIYTDETHSEVKFWFWFGNYEDNSDDEVFYGAFEEAQLACLDKLIEIAAKENRKDNDKATNRTVQLKTNS